MPNETKQQYICTRPTLVTELVKRGLKPKVEPSPWNDGRTVWVFDRTAEVEEVVNAYYKRIGRPSPFAMSDEVCERYKNRRGIEVRA